MEPPIEIARSANKKSDAEMTGDGQTASLPRLRRFSIKSSARNHDRPRSNSIRRGCYAAYHSTRVEHANTPNIRKTQWGRPVEIKGLGDRNRTAFLCLAAVCLIVVTIPSSDQQRDRAAIERLHRQIIDATLSGQTDQTTNFWTKRRAPDAWEDGRSWQNGNWHQ